MRGTRRGLAIVAPILTVERIDGTTSYVAIMVTRAEAAARHRRS